MPDLVLPSVDYVRPLSRPNLCLLSLGSARQNWHGHLASERMRVRLNELFVQFDYILLWLR